MATPAPANDYTTPGEDFYRALLAEMATDEEARRRALRSLIAAHTWAEVELSARAIFSAAAARFLSE